MTTAELSTILGEPPNVIASFLRTGRLKGHRVDDESAIGGHRWEITNTIEEAREILSKRLRRKSPAKHTPRQMPQKRDIFSIQEAARIAGVSEQTVRNYVREHDCKFLQNGRGRYLMRADVEAIQKHYNAKVEKEPEPTAMVAGVTNVFTDARLSRMEKKLHEIEASLNGLTDFVKRFARSAVGFEG